MKVKVYLKIYDVMNWDTNNDKSNIKINKGNQTMKFDYLIKLCYFKTHDPTMQDLYINYIFHSMP